MVVASEKIRHLRYESLRKQLKEESWPLRYEHKLIGRCGSLFSDGVRELQNQFPKLETKRLNKSSKGTYLSVTLEILAEDVDEVIALWVASEEIPDVVQVL